MWWFVVSQLCLTVAYLLMYYRMRKIARGQLEAVTRILKLFQEQNTLNTLIVEAIKPKEKK